MSEKTILPTADELEALWKQCADAVEEAQTVLGRVHRFINDAADAEDGRPAEPVEYAHIGALMEWAEAIDDIFDSGRRVAVGAKEAALQDLPTLRMEGMSASLPLYDRNGNKNFEPYGRLTSEASSWLLERIGRAVGVGVGG